MDLENIREELKSDDSSLQIHALRRAWQKFASQTEFEELDSLNNLVTDIVFTLYSERLIVKLWSFQTLRAFCKNYPLPNEVIAGNITIAIVHRCLQHGNVLVVQESERILTLLVEYGHHVKVLDELTAGIDYWGTQLGCADALKELLRIFGPKVVPASTIKLAINKLQKRQVHAVVMVKLRNLVTEATRWFGYCVQAWLLPQGGFIADEIKDILKRRSPKKAKPSKFQKSSVGILLENAENFEVGIPREIYLGKTFNSFDHSEAKFEEKKRLYHEIKMFSLTNVSDVGEEATAETYDVICRLLQQSLASEKSSVLIAEAADCIGKMASFQLRWFCPHVEKTVPLLLTKFTTSKTAKAALKEALDQCFPSISPSRMHELCLPLLERPSPAIRTSTIEFIRRSLKRMPSHEADNLFKVSVDSLIKMASDRSPVVRESVFNAIGTAMAILGSTEIALPVLNSLQTAKIQEICLGVRAEETQRFRDLEDLKVRMRRLSC